MKKRNEKEQTAGKIGQILVFQEYASNLQLYIRCACAIHTEYKVRREFTTGILF